MMTILTESQQDLEFQKAKYLLKMTQYYFLYSGSCGLLVNLVLL